MRNTMIFSFVLFLFAGACFAQPTIEWQKCLGGSGEDVAYSIQQTTDGGFIVAGVSLSNDGDVSGNHGYEDYWVVKLDSVGNIEWQKCLGGSREDVAYSIQQTSDGGFIVAGYTHSNDGDVSGNHGGYDYWMVKLNSAGNIEWQKCLGGSGYDYARSIQQISDGGYIVAGYSCSNDGDVSGNHGFPDYWVVKIDSAGNIEWQKCLGGSEYDRAYSIQQTSDGGYIVAGGSWSNDGNVSGHHGSTNYSDYWVVRLNYAGEIVWQKSLGGSARDEAHSIQQTSDGGFIVAGFSFSRDGDVSGHHGLLPTSDYWVVKLNSAGEIVWQKSLGGRYGDKAYSIQQTSDGGYIVAGLSESFDSDVSGLHGYYADYWIVKVDSVGEIEWQKCLGGNEDDYAYSIQQTADGGFIVAGKCYSNDGDVSGWHEGYDGEDPTSDYWIVKLSPEEKVTENPTMPEQFEINISPNPFNSSCEITVPTAAKVEIYYLGGNLVHKPAVGGTKIIWTPGKSVPSGVYLVRAVSQNGNSTIKRVVYIK